LENPFSAATAILYEFIMLDRDEEPGLHAEGYNASPVNGIPQELSTRIVPMDFLAFINTGVNSLKNIF
jgi:hypothetical protein